MIRIFTLTAYFIVSSLLLQAQIVPFARYFDPTDVTTFSAAAHDDAGSFMLVSNRFVVFVDKDGTELWRKELNANPMLVALAVDHYSDDHFIVSAENFTTGQIELYKVTDQGVISLLRSITATSGQHAFIGQDSLLVTGMDSNTGFADLFNCTTGEQLWSYRSGSPGVDFIGGKRIKSNLALFGRKSGQPFSQAVVSMLDLHGLEKWTSTFSGSSHLTITDIDSNGPTFAAVLWNGKTGDIVSLDEKGETIATIKLPGSTPRFISAHTDGGYIIAGSRADRLFLTKVDNTLKNVWFKYYGTGIPSEFGDMVRGLRILQDGSIALWGNVHWDYQTYGFLIATASDGSTAVSVPPNVQSALQGTTVERSTTEFEPRLSDAAFDGASLFAGGSIGSLSNDSYTRTGLAAGINTADTLWTRRFSPTIASSTATNVSDVYLSGNNEVYFVNRENGTYLHRFDRSGNAISSLQIPVGKRLGLAEYATQKFVIATHAFDIQPYNEVGFVLFADVKDGTVSNSGTRLVGSMIHHIDPLPDGGFVVTGEQAETYKPSRKLFWAKLAANGSVIKSNVTDLGYKIAINKQTLLDNGHVFCVGSVEDVDGGRDVLLVELDNEGTVSWSRRIDVLRQDQAWDAIILDDGIVVVGDCGREQFGRQQSFGFEMFVQSNGVKGAVKYFGEPGFYCSVRRVFRTSDERLLIVGESERLPGENFTFRNDIFTELVHIPKITATDSEVIEVTATPNPFTNRIQLKCPEYCNATLMTVDGKILLSENNLFDDELDCSHLPEGLYLLRVEVRDKGYTKRLVKLHR